MTVRTVIGLPLYGEDAELRQTLESLLSQHDDAYAVVAVDDGSSPRTLEIVDEYIEDPRLTLLLNDRRLGLVGNWRRAFDVARELHPDAEFFAWASSHDVWHPRWLPVLRRRLEADPAAVVAYPRTLRLDADGTPLYFTELQLPPKEPVLARVRFAARDVRAGDAVYGLYRIAALQRAGVFRAVMIPDRLVLAELALYGSFSLCPEPLWYRRLASRSTMARQRRNFFPGRRIPLYMYLPAPLAHGAAFGWWQVLHAPADGPPRRVRVRAALLVLLSGHQRRAARLAKRRKVAERRRERRGQGRRSAAVRRRRRLRKALRRQRVAVGRLLRRG